MTGRLCACELSSIANIESIGSIPFAMIARLLYLYSTCRHSYGAHWNHTQDNCPHLRNEDPKDPRLLVNVFVSYGYKRTQRRYYQHRSLIHFWKEWYQSYANDSLPFPRLIVRLEDIVYQPDKVLNKLCECAGGIRRQDQIYVPEESVKIRRDRLRNKTGLPGSLVRGKETAGLLKAWKDHAKIAELWDRMTPADQNVVKQVLNDDEGLMQLFHYKMEGR